MQNKIRVEIGGVGLLLRYRNCRVEEGKDSEPYIKNFIRQGKNDFTIDVAVGRLPEYLRDRMLFEAKENWRLYESKGKYIFEVRQSQENEDDQKTTQICVMEKGSQRARVYISPSADIPHNDKIWSLGQLIKIMGQLIVVSVLYRYQGILIHSSGVILNGEGTVFCGVSGAGKTTLAKLWQRRHGAVVLSDDRVIVRRRKEGYFVYGSPWPGEGRAASCQKAPLRKIVFLSKADRNILTPFGKRESLHQLLAQCFPAIWDKGSIDFSLGFCGALAQDIPCFSFGFVPDESAVEFIENKAENTGLSNPALQKIIPSN